MRIICDYIKALDEVFSNPPKTVPEHCMKILGKYPVDFVTVDNKSFMMVIKISDGFYGISWVLTKKEYQGKGYGRLLMEKVHMNYKGVFITKTRTATKFYEKHGYTKVFDDGDHSILVYINDKDKVIF